MYTSYINLNMTPCEINVVLYNPHSVNSLIGATSAYIYFKKHNQNDIKFIPVGSDMSSYPGIVEKKCIDL